jgi:capsular polysaccharide export protein
MRENGLSAYRNKRVLLLQGPVGPFFARFAQDLRWAGATVFKVNFNGGDWFFYRDGAIAFRGLPAEWPAFLEGLLDRLSVDVIMLFGDCRAPHQVAKEIASRRGIETGVFEEGYLRPHYITLERNGVNGHSALPANPIFYMNSTPAPSARPEKIGNTFYYAAFWACVYTLMAHLMRPLYPHYRHHRRLSLAESWPWLKALGRKVLYKVLEAGVQHRLTGPLAKKYFLVPLQVHDDAQIGFHSDFNCVEDFIVDTVQSFARHAPSDTVLVVKHHPLDRGHRDYRALLKSLSREFGLGGRLLYVHDQHLPSLLDNALGVVVINSTVGLSALLHKAPLKVRGKAIYKIKGLVCQAPLSQFWTDAANEVVDVNLLNRFRQHISTQTQINGSFYKRLPVPGSFAGMRWPQRAYPDGTAAATATARESAQQRAFSVGQ